MKRQAVKSVIDFEFQSDFAAPEPALPEAAGTVAVTASELAELLANARAEGIAAANALHDGATAQKLEATSAQLKAALGELLKLAECLDSASLSPDAEATVRKLISTACTHIVEGQGDLFADQ